MDLGARAVPVGDAEFNIQCIEWVAPGSAMARRALGGNARRLGSKLNLRKKLLEAWRAQHAGIFSADLDKVKAPGDTCFMAGFCLCCDERGREIRELAMLLTDIFSNSSLSGLLKPKSVGRVLYDASKARTEDLYSY
jgi:hypothetical protein